MIVLHVYQLQLLGFVKSFLQLRQVLVSEQKYFLIILSALLYIYRSGKFYDISYDLCIVGSYYFFKDYPPRC